MKSGTENKMKFKVLQRRLGLRHYECVGLLEALWNATVHNAPLGNIGKLTNEEIAAVIDWGGDADELIEALVATRWLDVDQEFRLIIHDWSEHAPNFLKGGMVRAEKTFADVVAKSRLSPELQAQSYQLIAGSLATSLATSPELVATKSSQVKSSQNRKSLRASAPEEGEGKPLDNIDWERVQERACWLASQIPTQTDESLFWCRIGVLMQTTFGESEVLEAIHSTQKKPRGKPAAYFGGILRRKNDWTPSMYRDFLQAIVIPSDVVTEVQQFVLENPRSVTANRKHARQHG